MENTDRPVNQQDGLDRQRMETADADHKAPSNYRRWCGDLVPHARRQCGNAILPVLLAVLTDNEWRPGMILLLLCLILWVLVANAGGRAPPRSNLPPRWRQS